VHECTATTRRLRGTGGCGFQHKLSGWIRARNVSAALDEEFHPQDGDTRYDSPSKNSSFANFSFPGEKIADFFEMWKLAFKETLAIAEFGVRQHFVACGVYLAEHGYHINTQRKYLRKGFLIWYQ
jgi:hypothetical protein